jgi:hypothetical protein
MRNLFDDQRIRHDLDRSCPLGAQGVQGTATEPRHASAAGVKSPDEWAARDAVISRLCDRQVQKVQLYDHEMSGCLQHVDVPYKYSNTVPRHGINQQQAPGFPIACAAWECFLAAGVKAPVPRADDR